MRARQQGFLRSWSGLTTRVHRDEGLLSPQPAPRLSRPRNWSLLRTGDKVSFVFL